MHLAKSLFLCLAVLAGPVLGGEISDATPQFKVFSFNLRTSLAADPCPSGCWKERRWRAKQLVEKYEPDFIGTQEGAPDQIEFFQSNLSYAGVGECAGECKWNERDSIFYKPERWEVLENTTFTLSDTPEELGSNGWNLQYLRAAVMARFRDRVGGNVVCILNTHFDIDLGHNESAVLVAQRFSEFCQPSDVALMTGDFNALPETTAIQYLENEAPLNGSFTPIPMYDSLTAANAGGPTWIGSSFGNQTVDYKFDYIFTRRDPKTCLQNALVLVDTFDGYSSSDHAVVMSEFCIGTLCSRCFK